MSSSARSQAQPPRQPANPETKNKDVGVGSKPGKPRGGGGFPRGGGGRRREPFNNAAFSAANPRRPSSRGGRFNGGNRQPPSRSYPQNYQSAEQQWQAVAEADEFEVGSLYSPGSKKQSLNHLLNFQYAPRTDQQRGGGRSNAADRRPRQNKKQQQPVYRPKYSKEQYLQANCQFVVQESGDYSLHQVDPDIPVSWDLIEEVHLKTSGTDPMSCPICLFPPTAGKISVCGHVFCWPCILHYLALSDDDYRKCPICYHNIVKTELKSVKTLQQENHGTGSKIEMRLMKRERNSLFAVPVNHPGLEQFPSLGDSELDKSLSKIIKGSPDDILSGILYREQRELEQQYREEKNEPEAVFIQEALALLQDKIALCLEMKAITLKVPSLDGAKMKQPSATAVTAKKAVPAVVEEFRFDNVAVVSDPFEENLEDVLTKLKLEDNCEQQKEAKDPQQPEAEEGVKDRARYTSSGSDVSSDGDEMNAVDTVVTADDLDISSLQPSGQQQQENKNNLTPKSTFYFYQDAAGHLIFLHALNIRMLVQEFGTIENCPAVISANILEKDSSSMTEELKDRLRYLRHLPVVSSFDVAELDLSHIVSRNTVMLFKDQLEARKRFRQRKKKAEKVREKRIQRDEMRIMGRFPSPMARIDSAFHYPSMGNESGAQTPPRPETPDSLVDGYIDLTGPELGAVVTDDRWAARRKPQNVNKNSSTTNTASGGLNFAKIAKQRAAVAPAPPPPAVKPLTGMVQLGGFLPPARVRQTSESEPEPEGYVPPPPAASLGDALAQALAQADKNGGGGESGGGKKKGKKSRGKPILLGGATRPTL